LKIRLFSRAGELTSSYNHAIVLQSKFARHKKILIMKTILLLLLATEGNFLKNPLATYESCVHTFSAITSIVICVAVVLFIIMTIIFALKYITSLSENMKNRAIFSMVCVIFIIVAVAISKTIIFPTAGFNYSTGYVAQAILAVVHIGCLLFLIKN